jgi:hypothetical protein
MRSPVERTPISLAFPAVLAFQPRKAPAQQPAIEVGLQLLTGVLGDAHRERPIADRPVKRFEIVAHDLVQRARFGAMALISTECGGL